MSERANEPCAFCKQQWAAGLASTHCSPASERATIEWAINLSCEEIIAIAAERDSLAAALTEAEGIINDLTPSPDGGYGPDNGRAWKDAYIARWRERDAAVDALTETQQALRDIGTFAMSHSGRDGQDVLLRALYRIGEECESRLAVSPDQETKDLMGWNASGPEGDTT